MIITMLQQCYAVYSQINSYMIMKKFITIKVYSISDKQLEIYRKAVKP